MGKLLLLLARGVELRRCVEAGASCVEGRGFIAARDGRAGAGCLAYVTSAWTDDRIADRLVSGEVC